MSSPNSTPGPDNVTGEEPPAYVRHSGPVAQSPPPTANANLKPNASRALDFYTNSALLVCVLCPALALAPPRKFDLYTLGLGVTFCVSAGFVVEQKTGRGVLWHVGARLPGARPDWDPYAQSPGDTEHVGAAKHDAKESWLLKQKRKEEEALDNERRGYGGLIWDAVKDVWSGEKKRENDDD